LFFLCSFHAMSFDQATIIAERDVSANGEAAPRTGDEAEAAAREARRQRRLALVGRLMEAGEEAAMNLTEGMAGRLFGDKLEAYLRIGDPALAWSRVTRTIRQLAALEERFDEDAETRAARIAAERIAAQNAARAAEARREAQALSDACDQTKELVHDAIREMYRDAAPETPGYERERLIDDLFSDYAFKGNYDGDPTDIVVRIMRTAYLTDDGSPTDDEPMEVTREEAQAYIDAIRAAGGLAPKVQKPDGHDPPD
jgi:hypothetical protein